jgi:hypothetical protein
MEGKRLLTRRDRVVMAAQKPFVNLRKGIKKLIVKDSETKTTIIELEQRFERLSEDVQLFKEQLLEKYREEAEKAPPEVNPTPPEDR